MSKYLEALNFSKKANRIYMLMKEESLAGRPPEPLEQVGLAQSYLNMATNSEYSGGFQEALQYSNQGFHFALLDLGPKHRLTQTLKQFLDRISAKAAISKRVFLKKSVKEASTRNAETSFIKAMDRSDLNERSRTADKSIVRYAPNKNEVTIMDDINSPRLNHKSKSMFRNEKRLEPILVDLSEASTRSSRPKHHRFKKSHVNSLIDDLSHTHRSQDHKRTFVPALPPLKPLPPRSGLKHDESRQEQSTVFELLKKTEEDRKPIDFSKSISSTYDKHTYQLYANEDLVEQEKTPLNASDRTDKEEGDVRPIIHKVQRAKVEDFSHGPPAIDDIKHTPLIADQIVEESMDYSMGQTRQTSKHTGSKERFSNHAESQAKVKSKSSIERLAPKQEIISREKLISKDLSKPPDTNTSSKHKLHEMISMEAIYDSSAIPYVTGEASEASFASNRGSDAGAEGRVESSLEAEAQILLASDSVKAEPLKKESQTSASSVGQKQSEQIKQVKPETSVVYRVNTSDNLEDCTRATALPRAAQAVAVRYKLRKNESIEDGNIISPGVKHSVLKIEAKRSSRFSESNWKERVDTVKPQTQLSKEDLQPINPSPQALDVKLPRPDGNTPPSMYIRENTADDLDSAILDASNLNDTIERTVREDEPTSKHELELDIRKRLEVKKQMELPSEVSKEAVEDPTSQETFLHSSVVRSDILQQRNETEEQSNGEGEEELEGYIDESGEEPATPQEASPRAKLPEPKPLNASDQLPPTKVQHESAMRGDRPTQGATPEDKISKKMQKYTPKLEGINEEGSREELLAGVLSKTSEDSLARNSLEVPSHTRPSKHGDTSSKTIDSSPIPPTILQADHLLIDNKEIRLSDPSSRSALPLDARPLTPNDNYSIISGESLRSK